jgi:thymidylate synthase (FAD)
MELIKPSATVEFITPNALQLIELAGRTCYKSEDKITDGSAEKFVRMILDRGHETVIEHCYATVRFICDRGVTHEIVRHRIASFSQESTRYCNYGKIGIKFIIPCDFELDHNDMRILGDIEAHYNKCIRDGRTPQQARYFLPNGLKTEIVMTANFREWRWFFLKRDDKAAHPQMQEVASDLHNQFRTLVPIIFD